MDTDLVDDMIRDWERTRPGLDASGLGIANRISLLAKHFERLDKRVLGRLGLQPWAYEVIAALRRQGPPYQLSPTDLRRVALLSSGAMTTRLDRLEERGLVERRSSTEDRRSFLITLMPAGLELADQAIAARMAGVQMMIGFLGETERSELAGLLRKLLSAFSRELAA